MKKIVNIVFCPQHMDDTREAIKVADELIKQGETVSLECDTNLIDIDCLVLLSTWGFTFSSISQRFIK